VEANRLAAFKYKGSVAAFANLPSNPQQNDVWETLDTGDEWYWSNAWKPFGPTIVVDAAPTENSTNLTTSGGVFDALQALQSQIGQSSAEHLDSAETLALLNGETIPVPPTGAEFTGVETLILLNGGEL